MRFCWRASPPPKNHVWLSYGTHMVHVWYTYGTRMEHVWYTYGTRMVHVWNTYGTRMVLTDGLCMEHICVYDVRMNANLYMSHTLDFERFVYTICDIYAIHGPNIGLLRDLYILFAIYMPYMAHTYSLHHTCSLRLVPYMPHIPCYVYHTCSLRLVPYMPHIPCYVYHTCSLRLVPYMPHTPCYVYHTWSIYLVMCTIHDPYVLSHTCSISFVTVHDILVRVWIELKAAAHYCILGMLTLVLPSGDKSRNSIEHGIWIFLFLSAKKQQTNLNFDLWLNLWIFCVHEME